MDNPQLKNIVEAALLASGGPVSLDGLVALFAPDEAPDKATLRSVLAELVTDYEGRGIEVIEVAGGWRIQVRKQVSPWVSKLWEERPARYSRALMETLALIAYRQPITRGEIEEIRGVSVSTQIIRTLTEREWVRVVGQRDVPGKPSLYATTREFLDYFGLKSLSDMPTLAELRDLDEINRELDLADPDKAPDAANDESAEGDADEVVVTADEAAADTDADADADADTEPTDDTDQGGVDTQPTAESEEAGLAEVDADQVDIDTEANETSTDSNKSRASDERQG